MDFSGTQARFAQAGALSPSCPVLRYDLGDKQQGEQFLQLVEDVRRSAIKRREGWGESSDDLGRLLTGMDVRTSERLVRAAFRTPADAHWTRLHH